MESIKMPFHKLRELAKDPNTPVDVLRELVKKSSYWIRSNVASNPTTPLDILRELAKEDNATVRLYTVRNPNTPLDILRDLAKDESWLVRANVARHPNASVNLVVMLFEYEKSLREPDNNVIKALYKNAKLPAFAKRIIETLFGEMLT